MKILDVHILPLEPKHYSTDLVVEVEVDGSQYALRVSIAGYAPKPSIRAKLQGWEPDWGMDHTESETHLALAHLIANTIAELKGKK